MKAELMNTDELEGKWEQIKGQIKEKWGKLTDDDITIIKGKKDQLLGKLQERYGFAKDAAETKLAAFMKDCNCNSSNKTKSETESPTRI